MKYRLIVALVLFWPMYAISGANVQTEHIENPVSQVRLAPDCLGLPDGAIMTEDFLQIIDIRKISNENGFTLVFVAEANGTAFANDGAWMWELFMHRAEVTVMNDDSAEKFTRAFNRIFVSKQPGVPNLHRMLKVVMVQNAQGIEVVEIIEDDTVCNP